MLAEFVFPLACAASVTRCGKSLRAQRFNVLLSLDYENIALALEQLRQAIEYAPHAVQVPCPIAFAVRLPLSELLASEPHYLIEQCALLIAIVEYAFG